MAPPLTSRPFFYTSRSVFGPGKSTPGNYTWESYIAWSKLHHLKEVVSLDFMLNGDLNEYDRNTAEYWEQMVVFEGWNTECYRSADFVLQNTPKKEPFNFLSVIINPDIDCQNIPMDEFAFMGYDLMDYFFENSALTNCGGFEETFSPTDLNAAGLIDGFEKAFDIRKRLKENNPYEEHANTNVIAIWRHKSIGMIS